MLIYHYGPTTGLFLGSSVADLDPLETKRARANRYMIPAHATIVQPPSIAQGQQVRWVNGGWQVENVPAAESEHVPTLEELKGTKECEIRAEGSRQLASLAAPYSSAERETWDTQQREARAWLASPLAVTPMLGAMAAARGITLAEMADKVMENVALFEAAAGAILGRQQALLDQLAAAPDFDAIGAITW